MSDPQTPAVDAEREARAAERPDDDVVCPFCGEDDFDKVGLKSHLIRGWCEVFNEVLT